ncbi:tetratricopeptide repeat protein [Bradyrhizobium yuanmingense]|uniref:tetratricopeptide repeat protein n=1 Tax=Bradyrhizobium yuanmingense TaxID=108015 RepID=UPI001CD3A8C8|nr:tetratricopeptide repeat protein [Bradyrhizobium yuanmingense]MCA1529054.1 tetratricopeptide repeat protein [Bradyrhizobium yuanmingense]
MLPIELPSAKGFFGPEKQTKMGLELRRGLRGIAFLSVLWPFCSAAIASDAQTYQTAAAVAVSKLDFDRAIQIYSKGLEQQFSLKDRAELLRMRGVTAQLAKRWNQAEADFTAAVDMVGSTDPRAYRDRGLFYHHRRHFELALADYTAAAKLFPHDGAFPNRQGLALMEQGKFDDAIKRFDEAIKLEPTSGLFMLGRAEAYNRSGRPQTALEDYDKALALGRLTLDDTYRLRVGVGAAHVTLNNEKAAIESLDKAVELAPNSRTAFRYRGLAYERAGKLDRASRDYETVLRLHPGDEFAVKRLQRLHAK